MPMYAKETELKSQLRAWFKLNSQKHKMGDITYAFANHKYDLVRTSVNALVSEGFLDKEKATKGTYVFWLKGEGTNYFKQFLTQPVPERI